LAAFERAFTGVLVDSCNIVRNFIYFFLKMKCFCRGGK
jgi:hypothetical protein